MNDERIPAKVHPVEPVEIYQVFSTELDGIEQNATAIGSDLQFALVLLPTALTLTASIFLTTIPDNRRYLVFVVVAVVAWFLGIIFAIRWWPKRRGLAGILRTIRARRGGPTAGQSGKEVSQAELITQPATEPSASGDQK